MAATGKVASRRRRVTLPSRAGQLAAPFGAGGLDAAAEYGHSSGLAMLADRVWVPLRGLE